MSYKELVEYLTPKENTLKNMFIAFISGGIIGAFSEILVEIFSPEIMMIIWIVIASILTGIGVFDKLIDKYKMGLIIPITGFSHSVTSSTLDFKNEGFITGIGANYLKLAGSVILYGIVSAFVFGVIENILWLL